MALRCCLVVLLGCFALLHGHAVTATRHGPLLLPWPGRSSPQQMPEAAAATAAWWWRGRSLQQTPAAATALPIAVDISIGGVPLIQKSFPGDVVAALQASKADAASNTTDLPADGGSSSSSSSNNTTSSSNTTATSNTTAASNASSLLPLLLESGQQQLPQASPGPGTANTSSTSSNTTSTAAAEAAAAAGGVPANATAAEPGAAAADGSIDAGIAAGPALYNSSGVMQVPAVDYSYRASDPSSKSSVLGLPIEAVATPDPMAAWVVAAWSISNFSSNSLLDDRTNDYIERMITSYFSGMAPGQVQLATSANVTLCYSFTGISGWSIAASRAMRQLAADMAGGYDPSLISVQFRQPAYGVPTDTFVRGKREAVTQRDRPVAEPDQVDGDEGSGRRRMLQQLVARPAGAPLKLYVVYTQLAPLNVTPLLDSLSAACGGAALTPGVPLTQQPCGIAAQQALRAAGLPVAADEFSMTVSEQPMVSLSVRLAVGVTAAQAAAGTDKALAEWLSQPRNIRNAIAVSGVPDPFGSNALIRWLAVPEIWVQRSTQAASGGGASPGLPMPGFAIGLAVGGAALIALLVGAILLRRRYKRQLELQKQRRHQTSCSDDGAGSTASERRRRRRHQGKRRYLLPDAAAAAAAAEEAAAAASQAAADGAGTSAAAEAAAGAEADTELSPDQIRPHLKELGDSVTSAVRFEHDDDDEEAAAAGGGGAAGETTGPDRPGASTAAAAGALAGGAAAMAAAASAGGASASSSTRVLAARQALLRERGLDTANSGDSSSSGTRAKAAANAADTGDADDVLTTRRGGWVPGSAVAGAAVAGAAVAGPARPYGPPTPAAAAAAAVVGPTRPWDAEGSSSGTGSSAGGAAAAGPHLQVQLPVQQEERGSSGSSSSSPAPPFTPPAAPLPLVAAGGFAGLAGAVVPRAGAKASPFALAYNFGDLAECVPPPLPLQPFGAAAAPCHVASSATAEESLAAARNSAPAAASAVVAAVASPALLASAVAKGSAVGSKSKPSSSFMPSSSSLLQGVGSTSIAVAPDGGLTVVEGGEGGSEVRYGTSSNTDHGGNSLAGATSSSSSSTVSSCMEQQPSSSAVSYASTAAGGPASTLLRLTSLTGTPNTLA